MDIRHSIPYKLRMKEPSTTACQDDLDRSASGISVSTCSTAPSLSSSPGMKRSVSFSRLNVRQYERVLGDNPSCSSGPSVSIGWKYKDDISMDIDTYELRRSQRRLIGNQSQPGMMFSRMNRTFSLPNLSSDNVKDGEHKSNNNDEEEDENCANTDSIVHVSREMLNQSLRSATERCKILSREEREDLLLTLGYSRSDLIDAIRENVKVKNQRRKTVNNLNAMKAEEIIESISRGVKKGMCIGVSGAGLYDEWIRHKR